MIAKELADSFVALKTSDTGQTALSMMEELKIAHLPIVNNEEFLGLISQSDIYNLNSPEEPLGNHILSVLKPFVNQDQNILDVIYLFSEQKLTLLPVLDKNSRYIGAITLSNLIEQFAKTSAIENPGGVITLEVNQNDYSLSEIAQIIESNDAKVLGFFVTSFTDSTKLELTIKLNKIDLRPVLQTFYRYNYHVISSQTQDDLNDTIKDRFDSLMNYLNI